MTFIRKLQKSAEVMENEKSGYQRNFAPFSSQK